MIRPQSRLSDLTPNGGRGENRVDGPGAWRVGSGNLNQDVKSPFDTPPNATFGGSNACFQARFHGKTLVSDFAFGNCLLPLAFLDGEELTPLDSALPNENFRWVEQFNLGHFQTEISLSSPLFS